MQPELFDDDLLVRRLRELGLAGVRRVEAHQNRSVMVSVTARGVLRVHRAYAYAPDTVLSAIVTFVRPGTRRLRRRAAERAILTFPVEAFTRSTPRRRRPAPQESPTDRAARRELTRRHRELNARHFHGSLSAIRFRLSHRMRTRLGEVALDPDTHRPLEIAISARHLARDGWEEVEHTLLHEMIHQWQAETGRSVDHGAIFRAKAREIGVAPRAMRAIAARPAGSR